METPGARTGVTLVRGKAGAVAMLLASTTEVVNEASRATRLPPAALHSIVVGGYAPVQPKLQESTYVPIWSLESIFRLGL